MLDVFEQPPKEVLLEADALPIRATLPPADPPPMAHITPL